MSLLAELKRRKVFRVATIYVVGAWLVLQVADVLFPGWGVPDEAIRFVAYAAMAGFPVALVFGWKYDITSQGIVRTASAGDAESPDLAARDYALLAVLSLVFVLVAWSFLQRVAEMSTEPVVSAGTPSADVDPRAVAILPFTSLGTEGHELLAEGLHQDLMTRVIKVAALSVISDRSVEAYRTTDKPVGVIASELGVGRVLTGMVQRADNRVRVSVQLVDALNERSLWGEAYDRVLDADNLFEIQADVAEQVAAALEAEVTSVEAKRLQRQPTRDFEAYQALLRGNVARRGRTPDFLERAIQHYSDALELEPDYAQAYLGMAYAYVEAYEYRGYDFQEAKRRIIEYATRAIELDDSLGEAYRILGAAVRDQEGYQPALDILLRGAEVEPGNARLLHVIGLTLRMQGRAREAMPYYDRAVELDPLSAVVNESRGSALRDVGRFDEAERQYRLTLELAPDFSNTYWGLGTLEWSRGRPGQAIPWFEQAVARAPFSDSFITCVALMYLELGLDEHAAGQIETLLERQPSEAINDAVLAAQYLAIYRGDPLRAIDNFRRIVPEYWYGGAIALPPPALLAGDDLAALAVMEREYPGLRSGETPLDGTNFREAIYLAHILNRLGDPIAAGRLLDDAADWIADKPRLGIRGFWVADAQIALIRGDKAGALAALNRAVDEGWRNLWRYFLVHDPILSELHDLPEFQELVDRVQNDMQAQAREFEAGRSSMSAGERVTSR